MKLFFWKKRVTAFIIISMVFIYAGANFLMGYREGKVKNAVEETVLGKYQFIEAYGFMNELLNKKEQDNFTLVKDDEGVLYNTFYKTKENGEIYNVVDKLDQIRHACAETDSYFMVISPPSKFLKGVSHYDKAYPYSYMNESIDLYERLLKERKIDLISLTGLFQSMGWSLPELFYKTDHHWTTKASFFVYKYIVTQMNLNYNAGLDDSGFYRDEENYNEIWYRNSYLGSQGRKTGASYSDLEDFCLIYPKFFTKINFKVPEYRIDNTGRVEDTLIETSALNSSDLAYDKDFYGMYLHGVMYPFGSIVNQLNKNGPKVLVIRDSYSCVPITYLAPLVGKIDLLYPFLYKGNLGKLLKREKYDYVMVLVYPGNYTKKFFDLKLDE